MKIASIIAEYNPFHNGHKYQIERIKTSYTDYIVVIMSTSFVQRGEPAIIDKFTRAKIAIKNGASLVIENPVIYSSSNAEIFSKGAINILDSFGIIDRLYFGSENNLSELLDINKKISENISEDLIQKYLSEGNSFIKAREMAMDFLTEDEKNILKGSNNILALEYIKALEKKKAKIEPHSIKRKGTEHDSILSTENIASASLIRNLIKENRNYKNFVPNYEFSDIHELNDYFDILKYILINKNINFDKYFDYEIGLENRMFDNLDAKNMGDFVEKVHSKRHSRARIKRLIISILLNLDKNLIFDSFSHPYIRILGLDDRGTEILKYSKNKNIIGSFKKYYDFADSIDKKVLDKEILATNLYNLKNGKMNLDFTNKIYKKI